ncbi:hypothetical protein POM88_051490 [Heracleum sosnowskyi]|uniref:Uncharacterized protein n=1 Tax=Heracleum sosnowskyi TaxID=360622 RepID=A0AAD8M3G7_9APIA|nr:hypothetical protein POM88_051490 [Heracleum sosnowskyi]
MPRSTSKTLAHIKKEQNWCYDPTIKYESLGQCAVPRYAYCDDSAIDWSDSSTSSDSEIETGTMTLEEAQTRKDKIFAEAKKEHPFAYDPRINYKLRKQFTYIDSPDSFASPPPDSDVDTLEEVEARDKKFKDAMGQGQLRRNRPKSSKFNQAYEQIHGLSKSPNTSVFETEK